MMPKWNPTQYLVSTALLLLALSSCDAGWAAGCPRDRTPPPPGEAPVPDPGNCVHVCEHYVWQALDGGSADIAHMGGCPFPEDPLQMFQGWSSQNWPLMCRAALYVANDEAAWIRRYFEVQREARAPGVGVGFGGTEMFSSIYAPGIATAVTIVHNAARRKGDQATHALSEQWLRAYWALTVLSALPTPITAAYLHTGEKRPPLPIEDADGTYVGPSLGLAGTRNSEVGAALSMHHLLTALATNWMPRYYSYNIPRQSIVRYVLEENGFVPRGSGYWRFDVAGEDVCPETVGLTAGEQAALRRFIVTPGPELLELRRMVGGFKATCPITFLRTSEGVISWLGTSTEDGHNCNGNKPPYFAVSLTHDGTARYLFTESKVNGAGAGRVFRDGDRICARATSGPFDCIGIPGGTVMYEVSFTREDGFVCVEGPCG